MDLKRAVDAAFLAELAKPSFYPVALVLIDWPTGTVAAHTGAGQISYDGNTYTGTLIGDTRVAQISVGADQKNLAANELTLTLYGSYADLIAQMTPDAFGRSVFIYEGATTLPGGNVLVGAPLLQFAGSISGDLLTAPTNGRDSGLILRAKAGVNGRVSASLTHSLEDHQADYPNDTLFARNGIASTYRDNPPIW